MVPMLAAEILALLPGNSMLKELSAAPLRRSLAATLFRPGAGVDNASRPSVVPLSIIEAAAKCGSLLGCGTGANSRPPEACQSCGEPLPKAPDNAIKLLIHPAPGENSPVLAAFAKD